jgi:hypothetical protein
MVAGEILKNGEDSHSHGDAGARRRLPGPSGALRPVATTTTLNSKGGLDQQTERVTEQTSLNY